eukprot:TRINITY_DN642_c0_g1_i3.p2 TRINITY_DN642_c0_g1~~TRINITY_DN642_c0_g1_i3.p2  ORF type:complete len:116 (+),score=19.24 TRINITY_DN642_c0_g1_i3:628-975(+)
MDGSTRYCRICLLEKPDRAHHCSSCGRCVLKMDHHCVWVGGCVGFCNYKYFFLFIMYIGITGIIGSLLMMRGIFETASSDDSVLYSLHQKTSFLCNTLDAVIMREVLLVCQQRVM